MKINIIDKRNKEITAERKSELYKIIKKCEEKDNVTSKMTLIKRNFFISVTIGTIEIFLFSLLIMTEKKVLLSLLFSLCIFFRFMLIVKDTILFIKRMQYEYENNIGRLLKIYDKLFVSEKNPDAIFEEFFLMKLTDVCRKKDVIDEEKYKKIVKRTYYQFFCNMLIEKCGETTAANIVNGNMLKIEQYAPPVTILFEVNQVESEISDEADLILLDNGSILRKR